MASSPTRGPNGVQIRGAEQFLALSRRLKAAGETELRKELNKSVRDAAKPLIPKIRESARSKGPKKGGLGERLAKKPYRTQTRTGASTAGVRVVGSKVDPRINDTGRIQHPVFGRSGSTVVQNVPGLKGYFDEPLNEAGPTIRQDVLQTLDDFSKRLTGGL